MKNSLIDLSDHLFSQMERLGKEDLEGEKLKEELGRSKQVASVAKQIIDNGRLVLDANLAISEHRILKTHELLGNTKPSLPNKK